MYISEKAQRNISKAMSSVVAQSELDEKEFSGVICLDRDTDEVKQIKVLYVGTVNRSMLNFGRVCKCDCRQITFHTHPTKGGGKPKFSKQDKVTINSRLNENIDDGSCVASPLGITCRTGQDYLSQINNEGGTEQLSTESLSQDDNNTEVGMLIHLHDDFENYRKNKK